MLNRIDSYIFKTVFFSFLVVSIIFCILFFIFTYLAQVGNDPNVGNGELILDTLFQLPGILYTLLPACAMVGALMGLSLLANNSEIIILRASGLSTARIARGVILVGIIGSIVTVMFGGYIAPTLQKLVDTKTINYKTQNIWIKTPNGMMHIGKIDPFKKTASNIRKFIVEDDKLKEVRFAKDAKYTSDSNATAYDISRILFPENTNSKYVDIYTNIEQDNWSNPIPLSIAKVITINDQDYLNINQLFKFMSSKTQASNESLSLKFWQEIFQPISLMVLILLSVPLSIGSNRSSTLVLKLILGALFGFAFFILNQIFGPIALILHIPPIIGAAGPTVIAIMLLVFLFIKMKEI